MQLEGPARRPAAGPHPRPAHEGRARPSRPAPRRRRAAWSTWTACASWRSRASSRAASSSSTRSTRSPRGRTAPGTAPDVSREGVQRDLLPIVEGSTVQTKHGPVRTDHILFIAAGAFHAAKPSDLIPELQGRFPIRVELASLGRGGLRPHPDRAEQLAGAPVQRRCCATEGVELEFTPDGVARDGRDRGGGERAHREHRRAAAPHRDGAPARGGQLRRAGPRRAPAGDRRGLRARRGSRTWCGTRTSRVTSCRPTRPMGVPWRSRPRGS